MTTALHYPQIEQAIYGSRGRCKCGWAGDWHREGGIVRRMNDARRDVREHMRNDA